MSVAAAAALLWWGAAAFPPAGGDSDSAAGAGRSRAANDAAAVGPESSPLEASDSDRARWATLPSAPGRTPSDGAASAAPAQRERRDPTATAAAIELDGLLAEGATATAFGFDPGGPRPLLLWRRVGDRVAVMARGRSLADGSLDFPELVIPDAGLEVVVTGAHDTPDAASASLPRTLAPRPLLRPRAKLLQGRQAATSEVVLRVVPAEASGEILVAAVGGEVFSRHPLPARPGAAERVFDLVIRVPEGDSEVWLAHERPDGRRSDWWPVALAPATAGGRP